MKQTTRFILTLMALALGCSLMSACYNYNSDTTIGWEPELAVPLVYFDVDMNKDVAPDSLALIAFRLIPTQEKQNALMYRLLTEQLDDSIKLRLRAYLRTDADSFITAYLNHAIIPDFAAAALLTSLFDAFKNNHSLVALDKFAYTVFTAEELRQRDRDTIAMKLRTQRLYPSPICADITIDALSDRIEHLTYLKIQANFNCRLQMQGKLQGWLLDSTGNVLDTLIHVEQGIMPVSASGERIICEYDSIKSARRMLRAKQVKLQLTSDSTGIAVDQIRDLYARTIKVSVGVMAKLNIDDVAEK